MRSNSKQLQPSTIAKEKERYYDFTDGKHEMITNIGVSKSTKEMFDLKSKSDGFVQRLEGREVGLQPWSLNRQIVEESMLAYTNRVRNLSNKQHTRHSHQSPNHHDRLAVQALMLRSRGHKRWAPLPKLDRPPENNLPVAEIKLSGIGKTSAREDKRATSDLGVKVLYNSDWDNELSVLDHRRPVSDCLGSILPKINAFYPPLVTQALSGPHRRVVIDQEELADAGQTTDSDGSSELDSNDNDYHPAHGTPSPEMTTNYEGLPKNSSVQIVAFPELPLQATPAVLHSNPKSALIKRHSARKKSANDDKKQGYQFVHRSKLPPIPKIEGVRKKAPLVKKDLSRKGSNSATPSPDATKIKSKLTFKLTQDGGDNNGASSTPDSNQGDSVRKGSSKENGLISVTVRKKVKGANADDETGTNSVTKTCVLPLDGSDINSQSSTSLPVSETTDSSGIRSVLRKGNKTSGKSVQFGDELEFVRVVTKIEYPWYNVDTSSDEETQEIEYQNVESATSESESSDDSNEASEDDDKE